MQVYAKLIVIKHVFSGTCQCNSGFGAVDCSIDLKKPPIISGILDHGLCDQNKTDCSKIVVFGGEFTSSNLTCRLNTFYVRLYTIVGFQIVCDCTFGSVISILTILQ